MSTASRENRTFQVSVGVLVLVGAVLGVITASGVSVVARTRPGPAVAVTAAADTGRELLRGIAVKDSVLEASVAGGRDPFVDPLGLSPAADANAQWAAPAPKPARPVLRALLHDEANPCVQLGLGPATSGWLHRGDSYRGWTIAAIDAQVVTVSKGGQRIRLRTR